TLRAMLDVEAALARVQGRLGIIPAAAAARINDVVASFEPDIAGIAAGTEKSGVPIIPLVEQLRAAVGGEAAGYVHWGATSQDIVDTGLVLRLRGVADMLEEKIGRLSGLLGKLADGHRGTVMAGRTRSQQALPTSFGLKAAGWLAPLIDHAKRLEEIRPRLVVVQFGGAVGTLAALGDRGVEVMEALGAELTLATPAAPWHVQRDGLAEFAGWLSLVTGSLGKMARDLILLAQSEVAEVRPGAGGGSSTMPQKSNPVACEVMVTLARQNATLISAMHQAAIQEHERGAPGWQLEWLTLPQMAVATGAALNHAIAVIETLEVDTARMRANLDASNGLILAEAAAFALAEHMPRTEAQALVKEACGEVARTGRPLMEILGGKTNAPVDWDAAADPANYPGSANELIDRILARRG
ncbi:MAG: 3-carboxy-cis,cis-muconate cycloisomerase, partial [Proteobacteria bacterium]|nr:3-carboxy-cis,cis-muconate cycloisomerase [Pseudomonadota bacterium]